MFEQLGSFDAAYQDSPVDPVSDDAPRPLRRRRSLRERLIRVAANLLVMPVVGLIYATIIAEGLRKLMPIFQLRLYKLPIPGAGIARQYDGWDRLDIAIAMSLLLFAVMTWLWCRIFTELQGHGTVAPRRRQTPIVFFLLCFIAAVVIVGDALIFYVGLTAQEASNWSDSSGGIGPIATLIYSCGLAMLGWWHSDYQNSNLV